MTKWVLSPCYCRIKKRELD